MSISMQEILKVISGRKGPAASIIMTVIWFLAAEGRVSPNEVALYGTICTVLFWTASSMTKFAFKLSSSK